MNEILLQTLSELLSQQGIYPHREGDSLIPGRDASHRSSARISPVVISVKKQGDFWLAGIDVTFALSDGRPEATSITPGFGAGDNEAQALESALRSWFSVVAPALFSVLMQSNVMGASWVHDGAQLGFPGCHLCIGPFVTWVATPDNAPEFFSFAHELRPLKHTSSALVQELRPPLSFLRLFWSHTTGGYQADCDINGVMHEGGRQALLRAPWPATPVHTRFAQFSVLIFSPV